MSRKELEEARRRCAEEPIRIPGSIQPHGVLLVLNRKSYRIEQASANCSFLLGKTPEELIGRNFLECVEETARPQTKVLIDAAASSFVNPFRIPVKVSETTRKVDAIAHTLDRSATILELEPEPSRAKSQGGDSGLDNYLQLIQRSIAKIIPLKTIEEVSNVIVEDIKAFTGFDRVMVYRFAADHHGEVIAESKKRGMEPYLNLHYPASDIPPQARELYLTNPVRLLYDVDSVPSPVEPSTHPRLGDLDLSNAVLRSISPIHCQYLRNMGVRSTLTVSLVAEGKLWGLIACHHRTPRFVPYAVRATASLYGSVMASKLVEKERTIRGIKAFQSRQTALRILSNLDGYDNLGGSLARALPDLMELFEADGAAVLAGREVRSHGSVPPPSVLAGGSVLLNRISTNRTLVTSDTGSDVPEFSKNLPAGAGLVAIPLGDSHWLAVFRNEASQKIRWAGKPANSKSVDSSGKLSPRSSFDEWVENVSGQSRPWDESILDLTTEVRSAILGIVQRRNNHLEEANSELRKFAGVVAHEVKNQLNSGIISLSLIHEKLGSDEQISQLAKLGMTSLNALAKFTTEMLEFAKAEGSADPEEIDLSSLARDAVSLLKLDEDSERVRVDIGKLPNIVAIRSQMFHLLVNLLKNAVDHARMPDRPLRIRIGSRANRKAETVVYVRDDGRGIEPGDQGKIFDYFYTKGAKGSGGSGIGLAFCAQVVSRAGHRIWVESKPGEGSTFLFTVSKAKTPGKVPRT